MQIPVSVHEQALETLLPVKREIQQLLCASLPQAGALGLTELAAFLPRMSGETEAVTAAVNAFGEKVADWNRHSDTQKLVNSAWKCAQAFQSLAELRHDSLLIRAEYDVRLVLLAVIDRVLRDILDWIERYESIVCEPEAWQGRDAHLMLIIEAQEELDALHRLLDGKGYALNSGMLTNSQHKKEGFGLMGLLAAFGIGLWLGDDD